MNTVGRDRKLRIFKLLVEGVGVRSVERAVGVHRDTILRLLVNAGYNLDDFLDMRMRNLRREHWEIDEMWTFCRKKEKRLTPDEKAAGVWGDQYLFLAIGQRTKLIPAFLIGKRNEANACKFMKDLAGRFQTHPILKHRLSTDGFLPYPEAVRLAFKGSVDYGIIVKEYTATEVVVVRRVICGYFDKDKVCTSHIERGNLTIRTFARRYVRRALGFSKKKLNLWAATVLTIAHYNFCWKHRTIKMSPAMAAGLTDRCWSLERLLEEAGVLDAQDYIS